MKHVGTAWRQLEAKSWSGAIQQDWTNVLSSLAIKGLADMLRYDIAFISNKHPGIVAFPVLKTPSGNLGGKVTTARWRSHGFLLKDFYGNDQVNAYLHLTGSEASDWYTFRHPRTSDGPIDYNRLERVSLDAFLKAKDTRDL